MRRAADPPGSESDLSKRTALRRIAWSAYMAHGDRPARHVGSLETRDVRRLETRTTAKEAMRTRFAVALRRLERGMDTGARVIGAPQPRTPLASSSRKTS
jgi:hypothetical protein